jgi:phosphoribosylformylglycinamidine cyclo-ligase
VIVSPENAEKAKEMLALAGETVYQIGKIRAQNAGEAPTVVI